MKKKKKIVSWKKAYINDGIMKMNIPRVLLLDYYFCFIRLIRAKNEFAIFYILSFFF